MKRFLGLILAAAFAATAYAQKTELTFYYPIAVGGPLTKVIDGYAAGFEKENPNIKVNAVYAGNYDDTRIRALAAHKAGQPAQLSVLFSIDLYELLEQDLIVPFDDMAKTPEDKAWLKSFYPALMTNGTYKGQTYGIPFQRSTIVLYWNKAAFKEAGLDPEKPPTNWNEMRDMAAKLVKKDGAGNVTRWGVMVPSTGYPYWMFQAFSRQNGQDLMNREGNSTNFAHPDVIKALEYWVGLGRKDGVMPAGTGINRIPPATANTIPQRRSLLRNPILSAGSSFGWSGGSDDGCSTQSSFYWGDKQRMDTIPIHACYSRVLI